MRATIAVVLGMLAGCGSKAGPTTGPGSGGGPVATAVDAAPPVDDGPCEGPPPAADSVCVQNCGPPVARQGDPEPGWSWLTPAEAENREKYGCPICLPPEARIATPDGDAAVSELAAGDRVITLDEAGARVEARVVMVRSTQVGAGHTMARVTLDDGRVLTASARHPLGDGRAIGGLRVGDHVGDARVTAAETVRFADDRTWDLVVSGPTGLYLADGVVVRSTIDER